MSVALSCRSIYSSDSSCWCSLKSCLISVSLSCVGNQRARWLLQDRECFETARQAVNLSSLHALPAAAANTNTNGCNRDAFSKVSHTCKMDQWFRDDGWVTVNYRWRRVLISVIPVRPLQSWVSLEGIITLVSCCWVFLFSPFFSPFLAVCWEHCVSAWDRREVALHYETINSQKTTKPIVYICCVSFVNEEQTFSTGCCSIFGHNCPLLTS